METLANAVALLFVLCLLQALSIIWLVRRHFVVLRAFGHVNDALEAQIRLNAAVRNQLVRIVRWQGLVVDLLREMNDARKREANPHPDEWR